MEMHGQAHGRFVDVFVDERQQAKARNKDKEAFCSFKKRNDVQSPRMRFSG
jgi:hypothetical protein